MKKNSKNVKEIELPLEFNPGLKKYEPTLPTRKTRKKLKVGIDWKWIILIIISIILITSAIFYVINKFVK